MFCTKCGNANRDDAKFCRACSTALAAPATTVRTPVPAAPKSPGVAAVLSFFVCGLGQIYNGQISKGILMIVAYMVSAMLIFLAVGIITTPILWIWGMVDAYSTAERINSAL